MEDKKVINSTDIKKINKISCGGCKEESKSIEITLVDGENLMPLCKKCRIKYHKETENDIIEMLKENIKTPMEIVAELDKVIIGQDDVKKIVAVEVYNHFLRLINKEECSTVIKKNNILLTGPSGTGKTLIAETLSKILGVPFVIANATALTESGYVGNDVETILTSLLRASDFNINKAKYGIVFIDEIDKIARKGENLSITKDVSGEGVQQALLKIVEKNIVGVPVNGGRIHPNQQLIEIDTTDILFICGGAFENIDEIVKDRLKINKGRTIGFGLTNTETAKIDESYIRDNIETSDLIKFGMIPEFVGRFPALCNLTPLDLTQLRAILKNKDGLVDEFIARLKLQEKKLSFDTEALDTIAQIAINKKVGARGLRSIMTTYMRDVMYYAPSEKKSEYLIKGEDILKFYKISDVSELNKLEQLSA